MRKECLLLGTLGGAWAIIPEMLGFSNFREIKLFANHPVFEKQASALPHFSEIWLITTDDSKVIADAVDKIFVWSRILGAVVPHIRLWAPGGVADLTSESQVAAVRELTWRLALMATERYGSENVCYCLAGGRKTMSSDLQQAATLFGANCLLHVIDVGALPAHLRNPEPETLVKSLPAEEAALFMPVILDRNLPRAELLDFRGEQHGQTINSQRFPVPIAEPDGQLLRVALDNSLQETIEARRSRARRILFNYAESLVQESNGSPFKAMYIVPPAIVDSLKRQKLGVTKDPDCIKTELSWLQELPKTDLHCHLGGVSGASDLLVVAEDMREELLPWHRRLQKSFDSWRELVNSNSLDELRSSIVGTSGRLKEALSLIGKELEAPPWAVCGWLIMAFKGHPAKLDRFNFGNLCDPAGYVGIDIKRYEPLGDLQGSCLLQTENAIRSTCRLLIQKCRLHNVKYLEVRCSPVNYTRAGLKEEEVVRIIQDELARGQPDVYVGLIFIGSRHGRMSDFWRHVELAQKVLDGGGNLSVPLVGFDLAGDERFDAEMFVSAFRPLFERCLHITVHAGETQRADSMWKAVYALHAERVGHGLKLGEREDLLTHFLDRDIGLEMCPSSNLQIVGFRDTCLSATTRLPPYPLGDYLKRGLKVSINTDNPGISRTDPTLELHRAASMSEGGLSRWDILQLIRNGFSSSFASHHLRKELLQKAERVVLSVLKDSADHEGKLL